MENRDRNKWWKLGKRKSVAINALKDLFMSRVTNELVTKIGFYSVLRSLGFAQYLQAHLVSSSRYNLHEAFKHVLICVCACVLREKRKREKGCTHKQINKHTHSLVKSISLRDFTLVRTPYRAQKKKQMKCLHRTCPLSSERW